MLIDEGHLLLERKAKIIKNLYYYSKNYKFIKMKIYGGKYEGVVYISKKDFELVSSYKWQILPNGYVSSTQFNSSKLHLIIMNDELIKPENNGKIIDHKNRNKLDCRRFNLRIVTYSENNRNMPKMSRNSSGRTGVRLKKRKYGDSWSGQCDFNGKRYERYFSIKKYGYDEAYNMALEYREHLEQKFGFLTGK